MRSLFPFTLPLLLVMMSLNINAATMGQAKTDTLLSAVLVTGAGNASKPLGLNKSFQAIGSVTAATGAATIDIEFSNDCVNYQVMDTLSLTLGTAVTSDYYENNYAWKCVRGNVKTISGTNASVTLIMAGQL